MADTTQESSLLAEFSPAAFFKRVMLSRKRITQRQQPQDKQGNHDLKEVLADVFVQHDEVGRIISEQERYILQRMIKLGDSTVSDVMIPRTDIIAVDYHITLTELKDMIRNEQHTRMPVYEGSLDKLKGFIHLKDLVPMLAGDEPFDIDSIMREIYFVAPSMRLTDLLVHMRLSGHHMGIVVDEYGGTDGLITLEDIFEALVGEIQDEHDVPEEEETLFTRLNSHQFEMSARLRIDDLEDEIGINLHDLMEDEDFDTIGGFIFAKLRRIPAVGEMIYLSELGYMKITEADPRRVRKVQMTLNFTPLNHALKPEAVFH